MPPHVLMLCPCVMLFFVVCLTTLSLKVVIVGNVVRVVNGECESIWKEPVVSLFKCLKELSKTSNQEAGGLMTRLG